MEGDGAPVRQRVHAERKREDCVKVATGRLRSRKVMETASGGGTRLAVVGASVAGAAHRREHGFVRDFECFLGDTSVAWQSKTEKWSTFEPTSVTLSYQSSPTWAVILLS